MRTLTRVLAWLLTLCCLTTPVRAQTSGSIVPDVVYGHKDGMALTFDVFTPAEPNGVVGILNMVSGGWVSRWMPPEQARSRYEALLSRGFTVFAVRHGSSPRFKVPEAYADVRRAVRFVRLHAETYGIDRDRLGVYGGSAGGRQPTHSRGVGEQERHDGSGDHRRRWTRVSTARTPRACHQRPGRLV